MRGNTPPEPPPPPFAPLRWPPAALSGQGTGAAAPRTPPRAATPSGPPPPLSRKCCVLWPTAAPPAGRGLRRWWQVTRAAPGVCRRPPKPPTACARAPPRHDPTCPAPALFGRLFGSWFGSAAHFGLFVVCGGVSCSCATPPRPPPSQTHALATPTSAASRVPPHRYRVRQAVCGAVPRVVWGPLRAAPEWCRGAV